MAGFWTSVPYHAFGETCTFARKGNVIFETPFPRGVTNTFSIMLIIHSVLLPFLLGENAFPQNCYLGGGMTNFVLRVGRLHFGEAFSWGRPANFPQHFCFCYSVVICYRVSNHNGSFLVSKNQIKISALNKFFFKIIFFFQ